MKPLGKPLCLVLALLGLLLVAPAFASAATYTVNSIGDQPDEDIGVGGCETSVHSCTLRAAIQESNASTGVADTIVFSGSFNGETTGTIALESNLPTITDAVTIEGGTCTTQAEGALGPCVGVRTDNNGTALTVQAADVTIEGLAVTPASAGQGTGVLVNGGSRRFKATGDWLGIPLSGAGAYLGTGAQVDSTGVSTAADSAQFTNDRVEGESGLILGGPGAVVKHSNVIGGIVGIEADDSNGAIGNRIEESTVQGNVFVAILLENGDNRILGDEIINTTGFGVFIEGAVGGNVIGGDLPGEENSFASASSDAIFIKTPESSQNEIGRNRGSVSGQFIKLESNGSGTPNGGIQPPPIAAAFESSARGTGAAPNARIRVFRKGTAEPGEVAGFLGEATADASGNWRVVFDAKVQPGAIITATQTNTLGGTSELAPTTTAAANPSCPSADAVNCVKPPVCPAAGATGCTPPPMPDTTPPKVTIKKAPKAKSTSTTAKFVFSANESGSKFKCKLDKKAFASCKSPKTYKKLKSGKHVFKLKATDPAGNVSTVLTRKFTVLE